MDLGQILSWVVGFVGIVGFYFSGKRLWWAWYINLGSQALWIAFALVTGYSAFLAFAAAYSIIFGYNAFKWTREHFKIKRILREDEAHILKKIEHERNMVLEDGGMILHNTKLDGSAAYSVYDIELIARVCHEANRILQLANDEEALSYSWHIASEAQRHSAIEGVKKALAGESAVQLHESWCQQKFADGWVYGEYKDEGIKTHPCLVPYIQLPEGQRIKDHMFRAIVKSFKVDAQEKESAGAI